MIETPISDMPDDLPQADRVDEIVRHGPAGALALAGIATAVVAAIWLTFYFLVFLPRGVIQ